MADMCVYQNSTPCVGGYALRPPRYYPAIPPWTIRVQMANPGDVPEPNPHGTIDGVLYTDVTVTRLFDDMDIYDVTYVHPNWTQLLDRSASDTTGLVGQVIGSNTPDVTMMTDLFTLQRELATVISLDTSGAHLIQDMFLGCASLVDVPMLDLADVTNCSAMFRNCTSLVTIPLFDTGIVTNFHAMFQGCTSLTTVPLLDTSAGTNLGSMFDGCTSLPGVPAFTTSSATDMSRMFYGCTAMSTVPLFDTSLVQNMNSMMYGCDHLVAIPLFDTSSLSNVSNAFYNCRRVETGALALYQQMDADPVTSPSSHSKTFYRCGDFTTTGSAELAQIPSSWK